MNRKADLYRRCHYELGQLNEYRQLPSIDIDVKNILLHDGAIRNKGIAVLITSKGEDLYRINRYLELAEEAENREKEIELRERDSFTNQRSVEESIKQTKNGWDNRKVSIISIVITLIVSILSFFNSCRH